MCFLNEINHSSLYNSDVKLEQFYTCLLKSSLETEDVASLEQVRHHFFVL